MVKKKTKRSGPLVPTRDSLAQPKFCRKFRLEFQESRNQGHCLKDPNYIRFSLICVRSGHFS